MEIEGFHDIAGIITLAKELHDIGRFDVVEGHFFNDLCPDVWFENIWEVITSLFSGFYNDYDDGDEGDFMIFTDDLISDYFTYAWEFGKRTGTPYNKNPYVTEAEREVNSQLGYCYSMDSRLLGYTKTRKTARQSKLIVRLGMCDCDCHTKLAWGLIQIYKWFSDKVSEFRKATDAVEIMYAMEAAGEADTIEVTQAMEAADAAEVMETMEIAEVAEVIDAVEVTEVIEAADAAEVIEAMEVVEMAEVTDAVEVTKVTEAADAVGVTEVKAAWATC